MMKWQGFQRGVNLGGWLSQFERYDRKHFETFITEEDIRYIASAGCDHVRVPVDYIVLEDEEGNRRESGYELLKSCAAWCRGAGIRMVLDLHETFGYSFDPLKDMDREKFFYDEALQERYRKLWASIAETFAGEADLVAFELLNEVVLSQVYEAWNRVAEKTIRVIRSIAPDNWIVVGGVRYNNVNSVPLLLTPPDARIVYNFHCYDPLVFTHQSAYWVDGMPDDFVMPYPDSIEHYRAESARFSRELVGAVYAEEITQMGPAFFDTLFRPAVEAAEKQQVPLYCGEYGVIDKAPLPDTLRWLQDIHGVFEKYGIGRALWNYRGKDFGLMDEHYAQAREEMMKYL